MNITQRFHGYCKQCPSLDSVNETNQIYGDNKVCETYVTVSCRHYYFCEDIINMYNDYKSKEEITK